MKTTVLSLVIVCLLLAACNLPGRDGENLADSLLSTDVNTAQGTPLASPAITAEDVVFAFLTAYDNNPDEMIPYLSPALRDHMTPEGVMGLLQFQGTLEGFVFTSGTVSVESGLAVVEVRLQIDGVETTRIFHLELSEDSWLINGIEIPH